MLSKWLAGFLFTLLLAFHMGCQSEREQQRHVAQDILAMAEAATKGADIPAIQDEPGRYGRGEELVRYMHERYSRLAAQSAELGQLMRKSDAWANPKEWSSRERIKTLRKEAERATWLITLT